jgi:phosphoglycerate dehydrogenase-like enzyme
MSPHIAAYTVETISRMDRMNAEDMVKFFKGEKPQYVANTEVLERIKLK